MAAPTMDTIVNLCKQRGFIFQSSEIYGGFAAVYDYGHYGVLLKNNIRDAWWKTMVQKRRDVVGLDSSIYMHPKTWEASGHIDSFDDPQIDCRNCKHRIRADHMLEEHGVDADKMQITELNALMDDMKEKGTTFVCPNCGSDDLTPAKTFSLMVKSNLGSPTSELSEENVVYLRPETCGGIYLQYKNVQETTRMKLPFGIAQVGKAFRNEIVARQFVFRTREFEQMEMQYFLHPDDMDAKYQEWQERRWNWFLDYGIDKEKIRWHEHQKLAHYASKAYDIEYNYSALGGFKEVEGVHARGDWDLSQHGKFSKTNMEYFDQARNEKYIPHILETSVGLGRLTLMFIDNAYTEEDLEDGTSRVVLKLDPRLAPIKVALMPLMKKDGLAEKAQELYDQLSDSFMVEYDEAGSIGKRYRRQDEIGTPYCVTVDYESLEDGSVTVRDRDSMEQVRVKMEELEGWLEEKL